MEKINKAQKEIIEKYKITKEQNIIYGTNIPMPNSVIPTPWKTYISFETTEFYFFYFDEHEIRIYSLDGENYCIIPWNEVKNFKVTNLFILGKMTIETANGTFKFQLNRNVVGSPWIKENIKYLENNHYFYQK